MNICTIARAIGESVIPQASFLPFWTVPFSFTSEMCDLEQKQWLN